MLYDSFNFRLEKNQLKSFQQALIIEHDGNVTAGYWIEGFSSDDPKDPEGFFVKVTGRIYEADEIYAWQLLDGEALNKKKSDIQVVLDDFHVLSKEDEPADFAQCILIKKDGSFYCGIWDKYDQQLSDLGEGVFYQSTRAIPFDEVDKWMDITSLYVDCEHTLKCREEGVVVKEEETKDKLNDKVKFKYGYDINPYYQKAFNKLKKEYPWTKWEHMHGEGNYYAIKMIDGKYQYIKYSVNYNGNMNRVIENKNADDIITDIYYGSIQTVKNSNYDAKFKYGFDINVYIDKALKIVREKFPWAENDIPDNNLFYTIEEVKGYYQYIQHNKNDDGTEYRYVRDYCDSAKKFIDSVVEDYTEILMKKNEVVDEYAVPYSDKKAGFGGCWNLEKYVVYKLKSGDYKVYVQAGDRVGGAGREFYISRQLCKADSYDAFLDEYLKIVPGGGFGLYKEDLIGDENLKKFFGF